MSRPFPYAERARAVNEANATLHESFAKVRRRDDPADLATRRWRRSVELFWAAMATAYPPDFRDALKKAREGDASHLDGLIDFLEADPVFMHSGYAKAEVIAAIKRHAFSKTQAERLRLVLLNLVLRRDDRDFRKFCRLAPKVADPAFRRALADLAGGDNRNVARRARWMLAAAGT